MSGRGGNIEGTKRLMSALVRMKPKPHEDMKIGQPKEKRKKRASASSKPKTA